MKISKLAIITAFACCAASQLGVAQTIVSGEPSGQGSASSVNYRKQLEDPFAPPTAGAQPGSAAAQSASLDEPTLPEVDSNLELTDAPSPAPQSIVTQAPDNPFSKLGNQVQSPAQDARIENQQRGSDTAAPEQQQPAGRQVGANNRTMVDTILHYGSLDGIPDANTMPVQWPSSTPVSRSNPVGHYMLQNWCVQGLWYQYPAERAAECQVIQQRLAARSGNSCYQYNRYTMVGNGCGNTLAQNVAAPSNVPIAIENSVAQNSSMRNLPTVPVSSSTQSPPATVRDAGQVAPQPPQPRPVIAQQPYSYPAQQIR